MGAWGSGTGKREVTVQAWPSCSLLLGNMDTTAMQVLEEEEVGRWLGHPGLKGKEVAGEGPLNPCPCFRWERVCPAPLGSLEASSAVL